MKTTLESDAEIEQEALKVLLDRMPASKVARLLSAWHVGKGDYARDRSRLFVGETVDSLYKEALRLEESRRGNA